MPSMGNCHVSSFSSLSYFTWTADDEEEAVGGEEPAQQPLSHAELSRARQHAAPPPDGRGGMQTAAQRPAASSREGLTRLMQV